MSDTLKEIRCTCGNKLFHLTEDRVKLRTNIIVFEKAVDGNFNTEAIIKCPKCKKDNHVPILLSSNNQEMKHIIFEK